MKSITIFLVVVLQIATSGFLFAQFREIQWFEDRETAEAYATEIGAPIWYFFSDFDKNGQIWEGHLKKLDKKAGEFMQGNRAMVFARQTEIWTDAKVIRNSRYFIPCVSEASGTDAADYPGITYCSIVFTDFEKKEIGKVIGGEVRTVGFFFKANDVVAEMEKALVNLGMKETIDWYEMMYAQQLEARRAMENNQIDYAIALLEDLKANAKKSCYKDRAVNLIEECLNPTVESEEASSEEIAAPTSHFEEMIEQAREIYVEEPERAIKLLKEVARNAKEEDVLEEANMMIESIISDNPELKNVGGTVEGKTEKNPEGGKENGEPVRTGKKFTLPKPYSKKGKQQLIIAKMLFQRRLYKKALTVLNKIVDTEGETRIVWEVNMIKAKIIEMPAIKNAINSPSNQRDIEKRFKDVEKALAKGKTKKAIQKLKALISKHPDAEATKPAYEKLKELENQ